MTAKTHDAFAFAALVSVAAIIPPQNINVLTLVGSVLAADIGAAIPDMDGAGNRLWQMLPAGEKLGKVLRRIFYRHRTITHSFLGLYLIYKFLEWLLPLFLNSSFVDLNIILWSIMIGYVSHLLSDGLTEEGVPLLFPINISFGLPPIRRMRIKTGKWFENLVVYPGVWVYVIWFVYQNKEIFVNMLKSVSG